MWFAVMEIVLSSFTDRVVKLINVYSNTKWFLSFHCIMSLVPFNFYL
jgi:hypothetical protein